MRKKPILTAFIFIVFSSVLTGCDDGTKQKLADQDAINTRLASENLLLKDNLTEVSAIKLELESEKSSLESQIETLKTENLKLSNTPERRLTQVNTLIENKSEAQAILAITELKKHFPLAGEVEKAEKLLAAMQTKLKEDREAAERKERIGFKVLKDINTFQVPGLKLSVSQPQIAGRWISDSYDGSYHYKDAKRDHRFITAKVSITAEKDIKNPKLPGFGVYEVSGKNLELIASVEYEFVRWKDYGSYLGNYSDYRNDFAYTATIPFTIGAEVPNEKLKQPMYLIAARSNCHKRVSRSLPPAAAYFDHCYNNEVKKILSLDDITSDNYFVIKSWNSNKL